MADFYVDDVAGSNTAPYETWAKAAISIITVSSLTSAGDNVYVSSRHTEVQSADLTIIFAGGAVANPVNVLAFVVDTTTLTAGGLIQITSNNLNLRGNNYTWGMDLDGQDGFQCGVASTVQHQIYDTVTFQESTSTAGIVFGPVNSETATGLFKVLNSTFIAGTTGAFIRGGNTSLYIENSSIFASGSVPTTAFRMDELSSVNVVGCDLSACSGTLVTWNPGNAGIIRFEGCSLHASVTLLDSDTAIDTPGGKLEVINCQSGTSVDPTFERTTYEYAGKSEMDAAVYVTTDGATDAERSAPYSMKMTAFANRTKEIILPLYSPWIDFWADGDASTEHTYDLLVKRPTGQGTDYQDDELWIEMYLPDSASTGAQLEYHTTRPDLDDTPADVTTDTTSWTGSTGQGMLLRITATPDKPGASKCRVAFAPGTGSNAILNVDPRVVIG